MRFEIVEKPRVDLYTICWNEEYMLSYFFRHYDPLVNRYVVFDDGSTDRSLEILRRHPKVEIRTLPRPSEHDSYVLAAQQVHNHCWKESRGRADWVVMTAVDEFLYAPDLTSYLTTCAEDGVTAIPALGYQMIWPARPTAEQPLHELVRRGCPWTTMNKLSIFNPNHIVETNQSPGRHDARPCGNVKYPATDRLLLLHYKYLSFEHTLGRHAELCEKLGTLDKANHWGHQYGWSPRRLQIEWEQFGAHSVEDVLAADYDPHLRHSPMETRWWRSTGAPEGPPH